MDINIGIIVFYIGQEVTGEIKHVKQRHGNIYIYIVYKIIKTLDLLEMKSILCGINGKLDITKEK